jgi:hypothetical protein
VLRCNCPYWVAVVVSVLLAGLAPLRAQEIDMLSWETEVDPYYTSIGMYLNLTDQPIPHLNSTDEKAIYGDLLLRSHKPRFMLIEASVYPMPVLGAFWRHNYRDSYDRAQLGADLNMVEALTAGFEEPYALSLFLGNMVTYQSDIAAMGKNKGFMGYLLSVGDKHLFRNQVIDDHWLELEWKIKGTVSQKQMDLDWSLRTGLKWHDEAAIADACYFAFRRDHSEIKNVWYSFMENSGVDVYFEFGQALRAPTQQRLLFHKNIPLQDSKNRFVFTLGLIRTSQRRYQPPYQVDTDLQLVFTPSIKFE